MCSFKKREKIKISHYLTNLGVSPSSFFFLLRFLLWFDHIAHIMHWKFSKTIIWTLPVLGEENFLLDGRWPAMLSLPAWCSSAWPQALPEYSQWHLCHLPNECNHTNDHNYNTCHILHWTVLKVNSEWAPVINEALENEDWTHGTKQTMFKIPVIYWPSFLWC